VAAYAVLYRQRLSVPYHDDYGVILTFANEYSRLHGLTAKVLDIATTQNNDYKLGFVHFVVAMELEFTGHLNFAFLVTLGNILLLAIGCVLFRLYCENGKPLNQNLFEFLPISLLLFSLTYWETVNWAMAGLQNFSVILFSLFALYLLIPTRTASGILSLPVLLLSSFSAMLAAFSSANGFLLAPVGLLLLIRRHTLVNAVVWCMSFLFPIVAYEYHYVPYHVSVNIMHRGSYLAKIAYYFAFLGCAIQQRWLAALLGFVIVAVLIFGIRCGFERTNPVATYFTVWILLTAAPVAWFRQGIASRYSIYSLLLLIFCYWFLTQYQSERLTVKGRKRFYIASIALAGALCIASDAAAYIRLGQRQRLVLSGIENYRSNTETNSPQMDPEIRASAAEEDEFERMTLSRAIAQHVYELPGSTNRQ
jgi:hypothetical protein